MMRLKHQNLKFVILYILSDIDLAKTNGNEVLQDLETSVSTSIDLMIGNWVIDRNLGPILFDWVK